MSAVSLSLEQFDSFIAALNQHDWRYEFSEDHQVWRRGLANDKNLRSISNQDPVLVDVHAAYYKHYSNQRLFNKAQLDKRVAELRQQLAN